MEGLDLNFVSGSRYLGAYIGPRDQLEAWVNPKWRHVPMGLES